MKAAVILSGLGVIFALITGLYVLTEENDKAFVCGLVTMVFEIMGMLVSMMCF